MGHAAEVLTCWDLAAFRGVRICLICYHIAFVVADNPIDSLAKRVAVAILLVASNKDFLAQARQSMVVNRPLALGTTCQCKRPAGTATALALGRSNLAARAPVERISDFQAVHVRGWLPMA